MMNILPSVKMTLMACGVFAALDGALVAACAACQHPGEPTYDAGPIGDTPLPHPQVLPACANACLEMADAGCKLGLANDCAQTFSRIDQNPGSTAPNGVAPTCACIAAAHSLADVQKCGVVCPP